MIAINVAQKAFGNDTGKINVSLKQLRANLNKGEGGLKKFGQALKGIGWAAAIAGAQAYLRAIIDAINGNVQYERSLRQVNKQLERGSERAEQRVSARQKELNQALELAKTEEERSKITEMRNGLKPIGLPLFYVPVVMRVYHIYSPCLEEGGA